MSLSTTKACILLLRLLSTSPNTLRACRIELASDCYDYSWTSLLSLSTTKHDNRFYDKLSNLNYTLFRLSFLSYTDRPPPSFSTLRFFYKQALPCNNSVYTVQKTLSYRLLTAFAVPLSSLRLGVALTEHLARGTTYNIHKGWKAGFLLGHECG